MQAILIANALFVSLLSWISIGSFFSSSQTKPLYMSIANCTNFTNPLTAGNFNSTIASDNGLESVNNKNCTLFLKIFIFGF